MDIDKLKQWMEFAQKIQGGGSNFWNTIFEDEYAQEFIKSQTQGFNPFFNQQYPSGNQAGMGPYSTYTGSGQQTETGQTAELRQEAEKDQEEDYPYLDIYLVDSKLVLIFELPGVNKEDVHLSVLANTVVLRGKVYPPFDNLEPRHAERYYGSFERKVPLPVPFNEKNISAKFINGLLYVSIQVVKQNEEQIIID